MRILTRIWQYFPKNIVALRWAITHTENRSRAVVQRHAVLPLTIQAVARDASNVPNSYEPIGLVSVRRINVDPYRQIEDLLPDLHAQ